MLCVFLEAGRATITHPMRPSGEKDYTHTHTHTQDQKKTDDVVQSYKEPCTKRHVFHCVVYTATVPLAGKVSRKSNGRHRQSNSKPKQTFDGDRYCAKILPRVNRCKSVVADRQTTVTTTVNSCFNLNTPVVRVV